ncbi:MAG: hypothetical protein RQ757_11960 [Pseudomonadales bacterium]|nr:hypothetical protein [Pseudomonadales bacterium]
MNESNCRKFLLDSELLQITGPDSARFLQGQLSCDVMQASNTHSIQGACCNIKGRVIADFRLFRQNDIFYLQTQAGLAARLREHLNKFIVFFKADIIQPTSFQHWGLLGKDWQNLLPTTDIGLPTQDGDTAGTDAFVLMKQAGGCRLEIFLFNSGDALPPPWADLPTEESNTRWVLADIEAGIIHVSAAMSEGFTPQQLNYDLSGVINFKKGCFPGQEIVARMHYRSKPRKRLSLLSTHDGTPASINKLDAAYKAGELVIRNTTGQQQGGPILIAAPWQYGLKLLAEMPIAPAPAKTETEYNLHSTVDDTLVQKLHIQPLSYP